VDILRNERSGQPSSSQSAPGSSVVQRRDEQPYTTLGKDTEFEGTLRFKEGLKIEGKFNGDIASEGNLIIGKTGEVRAEIAVGSIIIEGKITGNIMASDLVELRSSAELRGDITASKLKIEEGVVFVGKSDVQPINHRKTGPESKPGVKPDAGKDDSKKDKSPAGK
jgi:cytoskeletal protein CcmA (bactofilin family)